MSLQFLLILRVAEGVGGGSNLTQIYFSIAISICSILYNLYRIRDGAKNTKKRILAYVTEILQVGVGHIPHIAAIREGKLKMADFSSVPARLLLENEGYGLKRIFNAIDDGKGLEKIAFSRGVVHELAHLMDLGKDSRGETELPEEITLTLSELAREPEGKFLSSLLEVRRGLRILHIVVPVSADEDDASREQGLLEEETREAGLTGIEDSNGSRKSLGINTAIKNVKARIQNSTKSSTSQRDKEEQDLGGALAHIAAAFLQHRHGADDDNDKGWDELDLSSVHFRGGQFKRFAHVLLVLLKKVEAQGNRSLLRRTQLRRNSVQRAALPSLGALMGFEALNGAQVLPAFHREEDKTKVIKISGLGLAVEDLQALLGGGGQAPKALARAQGLRVEGLSNEVVADLLGDGFKWDRGLSRAFVQGMFCSLSRADLSVSSSFLPAITSLHHIAQAAAPARFHSQDDRGSTRGFTRFCAKGTRPIDVSRGGKLFLACLREDMQRDVQVLDLSPCFGLHAAFLYEVSKILTTKGMRNLRAIVLHRGNQIEAPSASQLGTAFETEVKRWRRAEERLDQLGQRWMRARQAQRARRRQEETQRQAHERQRRQVEEQQAQQRRAREAEQERRETRRFRVRVAYCVIVVSVLLASSALVSLTRHLLTPSSSFLSDADHVPGDRCGSDRLGVHGPSIFS